MQRQTCDQAERSEIAFFTFIFLTSRSSLLQEFDLDYLFMPDYFSKFPFVRRLPINMMSSTIVGILIELFSEQGIPERVFSNNGPQFMSEPNFTNSAMWPPAYTI